MDAAGTKQRRLASHLVVKSTRGWSPDGKRIAFAAVGGNDVDIHTVDVQSGRIARLTTAPGEDRDPSWSPDGTHLVFSSSRSGAPEVYVMDANGGNQHRLTSQVPSAVAPRWSPDGSSIVFTSGGDGGRDLYLISANGGAPRQLTIGAHLTGDPPLWSPDGSRIAFQVSDGENYDIGVVRLPQMAHAFSLLADSPAYDGSYTWSPDGKHVVFISERDGFDAAYIVDAEGKHTAVRLTESPSLTPAWGSRR